MPGGSFTSPSWPDPNQQRGPSVVMPGQPDGMPQPPMPRGIGPQSPAPPPPDLMDRYNQYLAAQGTQGNRQALSMNDFGRGGAEVPGQTPPAPAMPTSPQGSAPYNPSQPLLPGQGGYLDFHASSMGMPADQLKQMLGQRPELGEMLARADASRITRGEQGANLNAAQGGDPNALAKVMFPQSGGIGLTGGQNQQLMQALNQQREAGIGQQLAQAKINESNAAVGKLGQADVKDRENNIRQLMAGGKTYEQAVAIENQIRSAVNPGGGVPGVPQQGLQAGQAGPAALQGMLGSPANSLLAKLGPGLAKGEGGKPTLPLQGFLKEVYKADAANPGLFQQNKDLFINQAKQSYGPTALDNLLKGNGFGAGLGNTIAHMGEQSDESAALDAWRNALGQGHPLDPIGYGLMKAKGLLPQ